VRRLLISRRGVLDAAGLYGGGFGGGTDGLRPAACEREPKRRWVEMQALYTVIVFVFVVLVLGTVAFALFELTPFARHKDHYRDPQTGKRLTESPHVD
jgi:hypothetical protein